MSHPQHPNAPFPNQLNREKDLALLKDFCTRPKVNGWCSNVWYDHLIRSYPFEYLMFTQFKETNTNRRNEELEKLKQKLIQQIETVIAKRIDCDDISSLQSISQQLQTILNK